MLPDLATVAGDPARASRPPTVRRGMVFWLTGLSAAGKTTLATRAAAALNDEGIHACVLDGDVLRRGINGDLGFSEADRRESNRRAAAIAALFADAGLVVLAAFISPSAVDRARARDAADGRFHEVYVRASLAACEKRDPKGLYKRARMGEIAAFTGVSAPYESPAHPDLEIDTEQLSPEAAVDRLLHHIRAHIGR